MKPNSVKLPHKSASSELKTTEPPKIDRVVVSMQQHIGAACTPTVNAGDEVKIGQIIGDSEAFLSAPIHAPIAGNVTDILNVTAPNGRISPAVVIEVDKTIAPSKTATIEISEDITSNTFTGLYDEKISVPKIETREDFIKAVRDSGAVGLGGAGFPTHVKLGFDPSRSKAEVLVVNGAECEPYITADAAEMSENPDGVVGGIRLIMKWCGIPRAVIGVEKDKDDAIFEVSKAIRRFPNIELAILPAEYPQGAEKILVRNATGRIVKEGTLPIASGAVVINVSTAAFLEKYFRTGMPLTSKRITIDGNIVNRPCNVIVPIGTQISAVMKFANLRKDPDRILLGGPMMGVSAYSVEQSIGKTTNAVLFFEDKSSGATKKREPTACIRCGRCVWACSMNLMPTALEKAYIAKDKPELLKLHILNCMECGACSFVCPAKRPLSETNALARNYVK
ncbi:MAG: RnfABCDGE type electron transport complex subunit C [Oscillospiraceae bacterium]|jgi:electron transport complex protein RnfC|nr:RnfABCDGE type electron transport complex subunit C [Oscillospiraceae bacterium]